MDDVKVTSDGIGAVAILFLHQMMAGRIFNLCLFCAATSSGEFAAKLKTWTQTAERKVGACVGERVEIGTCACNFDEN